MRSKRIEMKAKKWIEAVGSILALIGFGGLGGVAEGHGGFILSVTIFAIGFSIVLWGYQR